MDIKIKLILIFGFIFVGQSCIQNGVSRCNCVGQQRACRLCHSNLYSDDSYQPKLYHSPSYQALSSEKHLLPPLQPPPSLLSQLFKKEEYQPPNIYVPISTSLQNVEVKPEPQILLLYPAQEYEKMFYGFYGQENYLHQHLESSKINPTEMPSTILNSNQIIETDLSPDLEKSFEKFSYHKNFKNTEAVGIPVASAVYSLPSPHYQHPCPQKNDDCLVKKISAEMSKKSAAALPLSFIAPTVSAAGLAVGLINYFRPNPLVPELQKLREDVLARFDKIDQELSTNRAMQAVQSDFFSEVEVKMNSLRKHHELYMSEANEAQTDAFKSICMDPAYNPITIFGAAESFLSFKKMDLQLQNDAYSDESYEKIKSLYRNIYDELVLLYGYCEAVVNGPGDDARTAKRTNIAENMVKNVNVLLEDLNQRRLLNLNTGNENSTFIENV